VAKPSLSAWLLLVYKVPPEPVRKRMALWRRIKSYGAVYLQGGVCLLPKTDEHVRGLKMLENEIADMGGEALVLETAGLDQGQEDKVMARFVADRNDQYEEFIDKCGDFEREVAKEVAASHFTYAELEENDADYRKLQGWLERIHKLDFCNASLREEADRRLQGCEAVLDDYAQRVFNTQDENRET
jgi:hypothetical protein